MSGTVTYKSDVLSPHREIYNGASAQTWRMHLESGVFPQNPYKITSAKLKIDIRNVYASDRHMVVTRTDGGEQLGDVPTGTSGVQELDLQTTANYAGITEIKTDGVTRWACQLRGGSFIYIIVTWEETEPVVTEPEKAPEPVIITGVETSGEPGTALHTEVAVSFDGVDISEPINKGLLTMNYTDNEEDEADDLQIKIQDRDKTWLGQWLNDTMAQAAYGIKQGTKGLTISAGVKQNHPDGKIRSADFGFFELDQLKAQGPPSVILIKGTSLPYSNGVRTEERDKSWENYTLQNIGAEIAQKAGLGFLYDCPNNPSYPRVEQCKQTDIAFLMQLCHDHGYSLKISAMKLIIFDQKRYESLESVATVRWMDGTYTKYDLDTQDGDTHYDQCTVRYYDAATGTKYEATANAEDYDAEAKEHTICTVTSRKVGSVQEAAELAAKILRLHNKYEKRVSFTLVGNPMIGAGMCMTVEGFGLWDEKYIIKQARHDISQSGYTTKVTLRTIPEGEVTTVKVEETKDEKSSGSGNNSGGGNNKNTEPRTKCATKVYKNATGSEGVGFIAKGQKLSILSGVKNGRRRCSGPGGIAGYIPVGNIEWVDPKTPVGSGVKDTKPATVVNGQVVYL